MTIRPTAVAGSFYPSQPSVLQSLLDKLLDDHSTVGKDILDVQSIKAIIVPHAGYIYSGAVAAKAYRLLKRLRQQIKRVVLLGPNHRVPLRGVALPSNEFFNTPLGNIPIDTHSVQLLAKRKGFAINDVAHAQEHSLEVHLPFLQTILNDFTLLPLVVGVIDPDTLVETLNEFWDDTNTFIIVSSDLSHFHPYRQACDIDRQTSDLIESKSWHLQGEQACGAYPLNGLLKLADEKHLTVRTLDLCNSGDTAGDKDRVVGYGAYSVSL